MKRILASTGLILTGLALVACTVAAPPISADPPQKFPDLNGFTSVDPTPYAMTGRWGTFYTFSTSDGSIGCNNQNGMTVTCGGDLPGIPPTAPDKGTGKCSVAGPDTSGDSSHPYVLGRNGGSCPPFTTKVLNAGQKLAGGDIQCIVGESNLVACINTKDGHGFVLRPEGSWTF